MFLTSRSAKPLRQAGRPSRFAVLPTRPEAFVGSLARRISKLVRIPHPRRPMLFSTYSAATVAAVVAGLALGLGLFTFGYARGYSYLTNDPAACANCHVMREHFDAWNKSSHRAVATCNDCHTPHALVPKYIVKAKNGFWHSFYFTTGRFPDPLRITKGNRRVTEGACRHCHGEITDAIDPSESPSGHPAATGRTAPSDGRARREDSCIRCHTYVGHLVR